MDLSNSSKNREDTPSDRMTRSIAYTPDGQEILIEGDPNISMEFFGRKPTERFNGSNKEWEKLKGKVKKNSNRGNI